MSNRTHEKLEQSLIEHYGGAAAVYRELLALAEDALSQLTAGSADEATQAMLRRLDELARHDEAIQPTRRQWQSSGRRPGPQLAGVLDDVASQIARLTQHMKQLESAACQQRTRLAPAVEDAVRAKQMQRAYGPRWSPSAS